MWERRNHQKTTTNEEKYSFTKTMHHVTSRSQRWQNYMNCTSNCFHTHPILQIWPPVTIGCLQTTKECSRERDFALMKKWYQKLRCILKPKINHSTKKGIKLLEKHLNQCITLGDCLWIKSNFAKKLLVRPKTYWVMLCILLHYIRRLTTSSKSICSSEIAKIYWSINLNIFYLIVTLRAFLHWGVETPH